MANILRANRPQYPPSTEDRRVNRNRYDASLKKRITPRTPSDKTDSPDSPYLGPKSRTTAISSGQPYRTRRSLAPEPNTFESMYPPESSDSHVASSYSSLPPQGPQQYIGVANLYANNQLPSSSELSTTTQGRRRSANRPSPGEVQFWREGVQAPSGSQYQYQASTSLNTEQYAWQHGLHSLPLASQGLPPPSMTQMRATVDRQLFGDDSDEDESPTSSRASGTDSDASRILPAPRGTQQRPRNSSSSASQSFRR